MAKGSSIAISVLADTKQFSRGMDRVAKKTSGLGKAVKIGAAGIAAAGVAAAGFFAHSVKAAAEAQQVSARTAAVLKSTGEAAGRSAEQITEHAVALSKMSGVDDVAIQKGGNILATFKNIQGVNFDRATESALDFAQATGQDMASASKTLGKALAEPEKAVSRLTRQGVTFTDQQEAQIKAMVAAGDTAGAQAVILDQMGDAYGGTAEKMGDTFSGAMSRIKNSLGRMTIAIGDSALPVFEDLAKKVADLFEAFEDSAAFKAFTDALGGFFDSLSGGDGALGGFIGNVLKMASALSPIHTIFEALKPSLPVLLDGIKQLAEAFGGALAEALPIVTDLSKTLADALSGVFAQVLPVIVDLIGTLAESFAELLPSLMPVVEVLADTLSGVIEDLAPIIGDLAEKVGGFLGQALQALMPLLETGAELLGVVMEAVGPLIDALMPLVDAVLELIGPLLDLTIAILEPLIDLFVDLLDPIMALIGPLLDMLTPAIEGISKVLSVVIGWISKAIKWFADLVTGGGDAAQGVRDVFKKLPAWFGKLIGNIVDWFKKLPGRILDTLKGLGSSLWDLGKDMIQGLIDGAGSLLSSIGNFFLDMLPGWITGPFKAALGIHSPSRVFKEYGNMTIKGLQQGLDDQRPIARAMRGLSRTVNNGAKFNTQAPRVAAETSGPGYTELSPQDRSLLRKIADRAGVTIPVAAIQQTTTAANINSARRGVV